jgi:hypothetical protein
MHLKYFYCNALEVTELVFFRDGKFEVKVLPDSVDSEGKLVLSSRTWKRGFCAMRNYNVPPGTSVQTPEILSYPDGAVIRRSQVIVTGPASTASSYRRRIIEIGMRLVLLYLAIAAISYSIHGRGQPSSTWLADFVAASLGGLSISILLYQTCFLLGKLGLRKFSRNICRAENEFSLVSLEDGAKGSQPSLLHAYYFMKYRIEDREVLVVRVQIDPSLQKYWSLVLYDVYGLPLPGYIHDMNAVKMPQEKGQAVQYTI